MKLSSSHCTATETAAKRYSRWIALAGLFLIAGAGSQLIRAQQPVLQDLEIPLEPTGAEQNATRVYGITASNRLISFHPDTPGALLSNVLVTNLAAGERIVGIDMRPANNLLYGLGSTSQLYVINPANGAATAVGTPFTPLLDGTSFGFDFNPTVDRIRVVSNTGQNLRLHPDTGAVAAVDTPLAYAAGDPNAGRQPRVVAAAYLNPDNDPATGTTLFDIDTSVDIGVIQNPPNNGTLNTFGAIGVDSTDNIGFDIGLADIFVAVQPQGSAVSFLFDFTPGRARDRGAIGINEAVHGIAIDLGGAATPPPAAGQVFGVTTNNELVSFASADPGTVLSRLAIANVTAGESILGIDFRPATNQLYGLGSTGQLYVIDTQTGAATRVGAPLGAIPQGVEIGFDFNPTVDRIRVVTDRGLNVRLHPDTGAVVATDGQLAFATNDPNAGRQPNVVAVAYTNPDTDPNTGTVLVDLDATLDVAAIQDPPNAGTLNTFVTLGVDAGTPVGFDIGLAQVLVALVPPGGDRTLLIDYSTGSRRDIGQVGSGEILRGLAISLR